eukprot:TRINITY_DN29775_c0_g1_i1.p1 TRINITY_DN29775_c0_g1~~TRINITY_DN29775_c0_g1_i1.p1  ORF type:complete len:291 (+),score=101.41 TRINITY_DN29775_c0_g1_i1:77-874(+)
MANANGLVAVVTGASSGMGRALAVMFAKEGYTVVVAARRMAKLEEVVAEVRQAGDVPAAYACATDVTKRADCEALAAFAASKGPVHILMNCAGVMYFTLLKNGLKDQWEDMIDVNVKGVVNMCGAVLPLMRERKAGHILNISSDAARCLFPALSVYCGTKAFVQMFSKGLRAECVGTGIRVTDIQPGDVRTNLIMHNTDAEAAEKVGVAIGKEVGAESDRNSVLDAQDIVACVQFAINAPPHVGVHELLVEPVDQMFGDPTAMNS